MAPDIFANNREITVITDCGGARGALAWLTIEAEVASVRIITV